MKIEKIASLKDTRQDGAINNGYLFSFDHRGICTVYEMEKLINGVAEVYAEFPLDKNDLISPHSNSVAFGKDYFDENDEFPLLYTNIYNTYAKEENKLKGVTLVYRIQRDGETFNSTLVQMIEAGFTEDPLWKSEDGEDVRPYGNCAVDRDAGLYYAYTMRDKDSVTRYFSFDLPNVNDGELCEKYGVKRVVLNKGDVRSYFDCDYHHYVQGGCCYDGKIYSLEGFTDSEKNPPAIRIIDAKEEKQIFCKKFIECGTNVEPEMIDFYNGDCYYTNHHGGFFRIIF